MKQDNKIDKLIEAVKLCEIHFERMNYALQKVIRHFPLKTEVYQNLEYDDLSYLDQLIFRFSKLQDSMGTRLFPSILESLEEDVEGKPFIDLLTKMEKLNLLDDHRKWLKLRETRNLVTHEYPFFVPEIIEGLNLLVQQAEILETIWKKLQQFVKERFEI
jgi:hypothetical protein